MAFYSVAPSVSTTTTSINALFRASTTVPAAFTPITRACWTFCLPPFPHPHAVRAAQRTHDAYPHTLTFRAY